MTDNHHYDKNLARMLKSALGRPDSAFQDRLVRDVLAEVAEQRELESQNQQKLTEQTEMAPATEGDLQVRKRSRNRAEQGYARPAGRLSERFSVSSVTSCCLPWLRHWQLAAGTAVVLLAAVGVWRLTGGGGGSIGQVRCLYGLVAVQQDGSAQTVTRVMDLKSGERVRTEAGSQAQIRLRDQSQLVPDPRTSLQVTRTRQGPSITLERGAVSVQAAKQPPGKWMTIAASRAQVKVLGTRLEVRLVEKPSGARQTRVQVLSGCVEMESGGQTVRLLPGTEGVADDGQPPVASSVVFEVNELIGLFKQTRALAAQSGRTYGLPAILDLTTGTLWSVVPTKDLQATGQNAFSVRLKYPAFRARAYTLEGAEIPTEGSGNVLRLDPSRVKGLQVSDYLILKVPGVRGLLRQTEPGFSECSLPGADTDLPALFQFHLPASARLVQPLPGLIRATTERNRQVLTLAARLRLPQLY